MLIYCIVTWLIGIGIVIERGSLCNHGKWYTFFAVLIAPISVPIVMGMALERNR